MSSESAVTTPVASCVYNDTTGIGPGTKAALPFNGTTTKLTPKKKVSWEDQYNQLVEFKKCNGIS